MKTNRISICLLGLSAIAICAYPLFAPTDSRSQVPAAMEEVLFWHFWGGEDRDVVQSIVDRFNDSQDRYFVRAVAMPGNNLDVKVFLAVAGGDPPDLINQDDPIIADWAKRGALMPLDEFASADELAQLRTWLFPAARRLVQYDNRMYGLCNGLDVRALYYHKTLLDEHNLPPPQTPDDLMQIAQRLSLKNDAGRYVRVGYLPDSRRLWAWGVVFGGEFYDVASQRVTANDPAIVSALDWMQSFSRKFGAQQVAAFRTGDQSLPGKTFPLLPVGDSPYGRYAMIMDGQWRVRDITRSQAARGKANLPVAEYAVCPLPAPAGGRKNAGWVNGNFFVVPRGAKNSAGAWEFMKFWSGVGHETEAAEICATGGWIPVSQNVVDQPRFQQYLRQQPLFAEFVSLAGSENQFPIPAIPGAPYFDREIKSVGARAMADEDASPQELLDRAAAKIQDQVDRAKE